MASADICNSTTPPLTATSESNPLVNFELLPVEPPITDLTKTMFEDLETSGEDAINESLEESVSLSDSNGECKICK